ncbi:hypothetical protein [Streptomyces sp. H036]|uniref:hypothetical protein n=1 Tax=Streptomyces sp. H036 TaxID=1519487 RepID=UPI0006B01555|nr:hypothetical protein [Streptomyces sp. H036]KOV36715.1 hypothetical protein ADK98_38695 [Streptomyces sp. H036]
MRSPARVIVHVPTGPIPAELAARSPFAGKDVCAEAGWELRAGSHRATFDEDVWDVRGLADAPKSMVESVKIWDFTRIVNPWWRLTAKEYLFAAVVPQHEAVLALPDVPRDPLKPQSCYGLVIELVRWLNFLTEQGLESLQDVLQEHCDAWKEVRSYHSRHASQSHRKLQPGSLGHVVTPVKFLGWYSALFTADGYRDGFVPWGKTTVSEVVGKVRSSVTTTPPVPDAVFQPAVAAALYVVETLGPLVADLVDLARSQDENTVASGINKWSAERRQRLLDALDHYAREEIPFPRVEVKYIKRRLAWGWSPQDPLLEVNIRRVLQQSIGAENLPPSLLAQVRPSWEAAVAAAGIEEEYARDAVSVPRADNPQELVAWTAPLSRHDIRDLHAVVLGACRVVVAALSGMRASELVELTAASPLPPTAVAGGTQRFRLGGKLIKGQELGGVDEQWVVLEPAYRAVQLAARLARPTAGESVFSTSGMDYAYRRLRDWVNSPAGQRLGLAHIPAGPVTGRMIRRTIALLLAQRPGGLLAAKIQLKHVSVVTTEGYAARPGGSQGTLLAEIKKAEADHHTKLTAAAYRDYQQGRLPAGAGARDLIAAFEHIDKELAETSPSPASVLDSDRRLENLLRQQAKHLHVQAANYCWFRDPSKALCLKLAGTPDADRPLAGMCDSARCPQATHHPCHLPVWQSQAANHKVFLANPRFPKGEKNRLMPELERAQRVVDEIIAANTAGGGK